MNVLFLTIGRMESIESHSLYPDLLRQFRDNGHSVCVVSQREKRTGSERLSCASTSYNRGAGRGSDP